MPKKTILSSTFAVLVITGAVYFASPKKSKIPIILPPPAIEVAQKEKTKKLLIVATSTEPSKNSSIDEIVDYLVDILTTDEASATEKIIRGNASSTTDVAISTNF